MNILNITPLSALAYIVYSASALYALWFFYLAVMNLKRAQDAGTLSKPALVLGMPLLIVGLVIDLIVNVCVASVALLEMPRELTVTDRLSRLIRTRRDTWRGKSACWFCEKFLDAFDPSGRHCK